MAKNSKKVIIINPLAKSARALSILRQADLDLGAYKLIETKGPGDGICKAREAVRDGAQMIIAAGGDGTVHEVVNGMRGGNVVLGILPIGSVNVLAQQLRIPSNLEKALAVIEHGQVVDIDLMCMRSGPNGEISEKYFVQLGGAGLDAEVVRNVTQKLKNRFGPLSYVLAFFRCFRLWDKSFTIQLKGQSIENVRSLLMGNGNFYGGTFKLFHKAKMNDGLMDILIFQDLRIWTMMKFLISGFKENKKTIHYLQEDEFELRAADPVPIELDGEYAGSTPAKFQVLPRALSVMAPKNLERNA